MHGSWRGSPLKNVLRQGGHLKSVGFTTRRRGVKISKNFSMYTYYAGGPSANQHIFSNLKTLTH